MSTDLYTALTTDPASGAPLLFAFHGTGGDETQFFDLGPLLFPSLPERQYQTTSPLFQTPRGRDCLSLLIASRLNRACSM